MRNTYSAKEPPLLRHYHAYQTLPGRLRKDREPCRALRNAKDLWDSEWFLTDDHFLERLNTRRAYHAYPSHTMYTVGAPLTEGLVSK